jgi:hypothetical protein
LVACALLIAFAAPLHGDIVGSVITVTATTGAGTATYTHEFDPAYYDEQTGVYDWNSVGSIVLSDPSGAALATIEGLGIYIDGDPIVSSNFLVTAGAADTQFDITTGVLTFPTLDPAEGVFSAQVGGTDLNGDGVFINGTTGSGRILDANSNGQTFALIVDSMSAGPWGSAASSDIYPASGMASFPVPVSNMWTHAGFVLSANDRASSTSVYYVIPEPQAIALLVFGSLTLLRKR